MGAFIAFWAAASSGVFEKCNLRGWGTFYARLTVTRCNRRIFQVYSNIFKEPAGKSNTCGNAGWTKKVLTDANHQSE